MSPTLQPPSGWQAAHVGTARDGLVIDGLAVWDLAWRKEGSASVRLPHPAHPAELHDFTIYTVHDGRRATRFAAVELSAGVWGFYRWLVPADAAEGRSADGSLVYTHGHGAFEGGRYGDAFPTAKLRDAATGALLFDGQGWMSSRVVPQPDGGLILCLEQGRRRTLFRIEPGRRVFRDLPGGGERPLPDLAAVADQARRDASLPNNASIGRRVAPDGSLVVELEAVEWANGQWVHAPRVTEAATGRVLLDLFGTDWSAEVGFPQPGVAWLALRAFRGRQSVVAEIDAATGRYRIPASGAEGAAGELPALLARLSPPAPAPPGPRADGRAWARAGLILLGALIAIAAGTWASLTLAPAPTRPLDRVPPMPGAPPKG